MSHSSRRVLTVAVLAGCLFAGSLAPAASQAKVTNKDLLQMDQQILDQQDQILNKLGATKDLLKVVGGNVEDLTGNVDQVLTTVDDLTGNVDKVLTTVNNLSGTVNQLLTTVNNLSGKLDQVLTIVQDLTGEVSDLLGPLVCQLLGICPSTSGSP